MHATSCELAHARLQAPPRTRAYDKVAEMSGAQTEAATKVEAALVALVFVQEFLDEQILKEWARGVELRGIPPGRTSQLITVLR